MDKLLPMRVQTDQTRINATSTRPQQDHNRVRRIRRQIPAPEHPYQRTATRAHWAGREAGGQVDFGLCPRCGAPRAQNAQLDTTRIEL